jgi:predicted 3-demethylubiquinone-9 3-methyltransferase (glyoxalase superfamily)
MDSAREHAFSFNEAVSLLVHCKDQKEIDYYWEKLSSDPAAEQCGWLKDKYGVSWQVSPMAMSTMLRDPDQKKVSRVIKAFLQMKKFDLKTLEKAYEGK